MMLMISSRTPSDSSAVWTSDLLHVRPHTGASHRDGFMFQSEDVVFVVAAANSLQDRNLPEQASGLQLERLNTALVQASAQETARLWELRRNPIRINRVPARSNQ